MERLDSQEESTPLKVVLRYVSMMNGAQFVIETGTILMLVSLAGSWDFRLLVRVCRVNRYDYIATNISQELTWTLNKQVQIFWFVVEIPWALNYFGSVGLIMLLILGGPIQVFLIHHGFLLTIQCS